MIRWITLLMLLSSIPVWPACAGSAPALNDGKKWRIAYYEGGPFSDYTETMRTLIGGLMDLGWIAKQPIPEYKGDIDRPYWAWLTQCESQFLVFEGQGAYSAEWDDQKRARVRNQMMEQLKAGAFDLVIAMGTWAGLDLANDAHVVPVLVLSTSDPVRAGIIASAENSGHDHVTARVDPKRYRRQLRMFSRLVGFQSLGIAYENTPDGRVYAALDDARHVAQERGFKISLCEVVDTNVDTQTSDESCLKCYRKLARESDAVYITALGCVDRQVGKIAEILRKARVPSFAMVGSRFVKDGIMLSISSDSGYRELGRYTAMKFGAILNGKKPSDLTQIFEDPLDVAINMETVRQIGFDMPESIIRIATEIYER